MVNSKIVPKFGYRGEPEGMVIHSTECLGPIALIAAGLIDRWGMVAAMPDGEDSAGRSRVRLATVEEVVCRAFDAAEGLYDEARNRGHILNAPTWEELLIQGEEERKKN